MGTSTEITLAVHAYLRVYDMYVHAHILRICVKLTGRLAENIKTNKPANLGV